MKATKFSVQIQGIKIGPQALLPSYRPLKGDLEVWASTEVDKTDLKRDVEEACLGMTRYSNHCLPTGKIQMAKHHYIQW